jgi:pimeloyl-ACP methyl ester carboxylesterase
MFIRHWKPLHPNGETALLIHGLASSSLTWSRLGRHLARLGYDVVAPDLTGHGHSAWKPSYSVQDWTDEIVELGYTPDLIIGHSIGGLIAANLSHEFESAQTVLLDPVFHLPKSRFVLKAVQFVFSIQLRRSKPPANHERHHLVEHSSMRKWDARSIEALAAPHSIAKKFLANTPDALMIRAGKSYIFPHVNPHRANVHFEHYLKAGHNIHLESFDKFTESLAKYLRPLTNHQLI